MPMDASSMVRTITKRPSLVVPRFCVTYLEQRGIGCVVDFGELDKRWNLPFCLLVVSSVGLCLLWFVVCAAFVFGRGGYHRDNVLFKSRG